MAVAVDLIVIWLEIKEKGSNDTSRQFDTWAQTDEEALIAMHL